VSRSSSSCDQAPLETCPAICAHQRLRQSLLVLPGTRVAIACHLLGGVAPGSSAPYLSDNYPQDMTEERVSGDGYEGTQLTTRSRARVLLRESDFQRVMLAPELLTSSYRVQQRTVLLVCPCPSFAVLRGRRCRRRCCRSLRGHVSEGGKGNRTTLCGTHGQTNLSRNGHYDVTRLHCL
jgi:hypothetical protein